MIEYDKLSPVRRLRDRILEVFTGKEEVVEDIITCLLAGGHVLLEDVPGVGKTTLARTLATAMDCSFGRIQFTPDTLPTDVTGVSIYDMRSGEFHYREGAIMHQLLLADEINRTSPKTQACLLEAMAEGQVTVDAVVYRLPEPFMVIATQNPSEFIGTYPLPEAQLDRFMMRLSLGYPSDTEQDRLIRNYLKGVYEHPVESVCTSQDILSMMEQVRTVNVSDALIRYVMDITGATRTEPRFTLGASPRAMLMVIAAARARAFMEGRDFVKPDDIKRVAVNVLHHRLKLTSEARLGGEDTDRIIEALIQRTRIPVG